MGRLRTLTVLMTLSAWGAVTDGAPPDGGTPPAASSTRPDPPAPPSKYVEAGAYLFDQKQDFNLAAQYFRAANDYRDQLSAAEQSRLDSYLAKLPQEGGGAEAAAPEMAPAIASPSGAAPAATVPSMAGPSDNSAPIRRTPPVAGDKQSARWLLQQARDLSGQGRYDEAGAKVAEARAMNIRWGLFDDTPDRVTKDMEKSRPKNVSVAAAPASGQGDRRDAKATLKQAREALEAGQLDQAEAIASEVSSRGLRYGMFEDNPEKVIAAVQALRRRDAVRNSNVAGAVQDLYLVAVQEAREAMAAGQLDVAEEKARKALAMNVVPPLEADRAESVLHDLSIVRSGGTLAAPVDPTVQPAQGAAGGSPMISLTPAGVEDYSTQPVAMDVLPAAPEMPADVAVGEPMPVDVASGEPMPADVAVGEPMPSSNVSPGEAMLIQARTLMSTGNHAAARQVAEQAKASGSGVEAEADDLLAQIALSAQGSSLQLYEAALDALRKGDTERARALLVEVAASENPDEGLTQKVQDLLARLPGEQAGRATLEAVNDADSVKSQKMNVEVGTKVAEARRMLETDPAKAITLLEETLTAVKASDVNPTAARTMVRRVEVAIELAKKEKAGFDEKMKDKKYREEIEVKRLRLIEADKAKMAQMDELMTKATEAQAQGNYAEAEQFARMAAEVDPNNVAAVALSTKARWQRRYERDVRIKDEMDESAVEAFQSVSEAGIMPTDVQQRSISYPKSFSDLTRSRRELAMRLEPKKNQKVLATESKLNESITINMEQEQSLQGVVDFLSSYSGLNFHLDAGALAEEGLTPNSPVAAIKLKDVSLKLVMKTLLAPLRLTYRVDENVVLITSPQASQSQTYPVAYPVADLIISPHGRGKNPAMTPGLNGMNVGPVDNGNPNQAMFPGETSTSPGMDGSLASDGTDGGARVVQGQRQLSREDFEPLVQLIRASAAPGTWQDGTDEYGGMGGFGLGGGAGGGGGELGVGAEQAIGSITPFFLNISLIIRHTSEVHDEIVDLLRQLRRLQDLQISVEVRFITVSDNFFEEIGVDFDFAIQSDTVGKKSSFAIPNPAATFYDPTGGGTGGGALTAPYLINPARDHSIGGGQEPMVVGTNAPTNNISQPQFQPNLMIPFVQDSISAISPFNALTSNTGATFGLAFLSDLEVYFFLRAVQGDQRSNLVQAPKVTTFNGAPASVFSTTQSNYVAALTPVVGAGAVAFQPQIGSFQDGVQLFVTPVVSADRRYVRMTLSPIFQTLQGFDTFTVPAAVGGGGLGGGATSINGQIQLPRFTLNQVSTTVTVPDGGTVLLGGVKRLREERKEFGVPILSKVPMVNRLFRNIGIGRTTDSLMLMVTPRIIILEEEEERLGIPAVENVTF